MWVVSCHSVALMLYYSQGIHVLLKNQPVSGAYKSIMIYYNIFFRGQSKTNGALASWFLFPAKDFFLKCISRLPFFCSDLLKSYSMLCSRRCYQLICRIIMEHYTFVTLPYT